MNDSLEIKKIDIKRILKGTLISIVITLILLIIYATILTYTKISEATIPTVTMLITAVSILIGSQMTTLHIKNNGIVNGAMVGLIYIVFIYMLSSIINGNFSLNVSAIIMMVASIIAGGIGGIIGVNMK